VREPSRVVPVAGGWDTALWRVDWHGGRYALRVYRPDQTSVWRRESAALQALSAAGVPVPRLHAAVVALDRPSLLLSWCEGRTVLDDVRARPWLLVRLGVEMGRLHARIHSVPVTGELSRGLPVWTPRAEDSDPALERALRTAAGGRRSVLHLDYHPLNILSHRRVITCVLDWANVAVGDARADLARTVTLLRLPPMPPGTPVLLGRAFRGILELAWRRGYRERQPAESFARMDPFYVWAGRMMQRDLRPKLGRPGVWLQEADLERIRVWTETRARRMTTT
jgi:aminoglycoside phosphotransferase (APT) family kinase protein